MLDSDRSLKELRFVRRYADADYRSILAIILQGARHLFGPQEIKLFCQPNAVQLFSINKHSQ